MLHEFSQLLLLLIFAALISKAIAELLRGIAIVMTEKSDYEEFYGEHFDYDREVTQDYDIVEDEFGYKSYLIKKDVDND